MPQYVTLGTVRPLGWVVFTGCLTAAVFAFRAGESWPATAFMGFPLLGVYLLIGVYGRYAVDEAALYAITPLRWHYRIGFSFTNRGYAQAFRQANAEAIARKQLFVDGTYL